MDAKEETINVPDTNNLFEDHYSEGHLHFTGLGTSIISFS